jgi:hypothetical protein
VSFASIFTRARSLQRTRRRRLGSSPNCFVIWQTMFAFRKKRWPPTHSRSGRHTCVFCLTKARFCRMQSSNDRHGMIVDSERKCSPFQPSRLPSREVGRKVFSLRKQQRFVICDISCVKAQPTCLWSTCHLWRSIVNARTRKGEVRW